MGFAPTRGWGRPLARKTAKPVMVDMTGVDWDKLNEAIHEINRRLPVHMDKSDKPLLWAINFLKDIRDEAAAQLGNDKAHGKKGQS